MRYNKCEQWQCTFHPQSETVSKEQREALSLMCPVCENPTCNAEPHVVGEGCQNCLLCENKIGYVRAGSPKPLLEIAVPILNEVEQQPEVLEVIEIGLRSEGKKTP